MRLALPFVLILIAAGSVTGAGAVPSGPPGQWTRISDTNGINIDAVGLARTADGVLHVAWEAHEPNNRGGLRHTAVAANGRVSGTHTIVTNWLGMNKPDLIRTADGGLRIFFGGRREAFRNDPNDSLNTATAPASGASWTLQPGSVTPTTTVYARTVGAALGRDGTPVVAWDGNRREAGVHFGIDRGGPEFRYAEDLGTETCCAVNADIGVDSVTGEVVVAWHSNLSNAQGTFSRSVSPSGLGSARLAPDSRRSDSQRTAVTGRLGAPGVYIAYGAGTGTTADSVRVIRHGAAAPAITLRREGRFINIAAAPEGRLWLMWAQRNRLFFTRTNEAATRAGDVVSVAPPQGTTSIWRLAGEGSTGPLDVLAHVSTPGSLATWHTQVLPAIHADAKGLKDAIQVKVTEAGDPIAGATVRVGPRSARTNARGLVVIRSKPGVVTATVTKAGYRRDTDRARVRSGRRR